MSKKHKESHKKQEVISEVVEAPVSDCSKVKMIFKEAKFYNDLETPIFKPGEIYELEGADWIQRWIKRGGAIVDQKTNEPVPADGDKGEKVEETIFQDESKEGSDSL